MSAQPCLSPSRGGGVCRDAAEPTPPTGRRTRCRSARSPVCRRERQRGRPLAPPPRTRNTFMTAAAVPPAVRPLPRSLPALRAGARGPAVGAVLRACGSSSASAVCSITSCAPEAQHGPQRQWLRVAVDREEGELLLAVMDGGGVEHGNRRSPGGVGRRVGLHAQHGPAPVAGGVRNGKKVVCRQAAPPVSVGSGRWRSRAGPGRRSSPGRRASAA